MADRTSTRNRPNTPQSPSRSHESLEVSRQSPQRRTTRNTRSQSRDISDSETSRAGGKGGRRSARQANAQGPQSVKGEKTAGGGKGKADAATSAAEELSTVAEEADIAYPDLAQNAAAQGLEQLSAAVQGTPGALSGTTARTSLPMQEFKDSKAQEMLDTLPDLCAAADKVIQWLIPEEITEGAIASMREDLRYPDSRLSKNIKRLGNVLQAHKEIYGDKIDNYIFTQPVLKDLLGSDDGADLDEPWHPAPLLQKANLATFLVNITRAYGEKFNNEHFDLVERSFPAPFLSHSSSIDDLSIAVELRTQHFMMLLTRYSDVPNFDPDLILQQAFYVGTSAETLKGWSVSGLKEGDLNSDFQELIARRLSEIRGHFSSGRTVYQSLKATYPWTPFVTQIIAWSRSRLDDIEILMDSHGGVDAIVEALGAKVQSDASSAAMNPVRDGASPAVELDYPSASEFSNTVSDRSELNRLAAARAAGAREGKVRFNTPAAMLIGLQHIKNMKARYERQQEANAHNAQLSAPVAPMAPDQARNGGIFSAVTGSTANGYMSGALGGDDWQPADIDEIPRTISPSDDMQGTAMRVIQRAAERDAAMGKKSVTFSSQYDIPPSGSPQHQGIGPRKLRITDRQPNAQRVEWEDPRFSQDVSSTPRGSKRGHAAAVEDDDFEPAPSQDEGFQQDNRNLDVAAKRRSKPPGRPPKKTRFSQAQQRAQSPTENAVATAVNDYNQGGSPLPSALDVYQATHDRALNVAATQPKKIQVRKAWTDEETQTLLELIETHGTSWRLLKDIDEKAGFVLSGRDQVALKDKARNMKLDFLKAGHELPENFQFVPLNKIQIQKLHDLGLDYDQDRGRRSAAYD